MKVPAITFAASLFFLQIVLIILYATLVDYDLASSSQDIRGFYPVFQDVHVMIFVGFGFLMTFLRKYGFSSVGYNMMIAAITIQWSMLVTSWLANAADGKSSPSKVKLGVKNLILADFNAGAVLITFGAVLGKTSRLQMVIIAIIETVLYGVNEMVLVHYIKVTDVGGSMVIHMFGAYFGLAVAFSLRKSDLRDEENPKEGSNISSDLFAMIGTLFLWVYWPSFNGAMLGPGNLQSRAIVNTYLSLAGCCISTFVVSSLVDPKKKLNMVHIQNATLAGGVAIGAAANLDVHPWGAMLVGVIGGMLTTFGYRYLTPLLLQKFNLHDTCGVHNIHGLPAIFAGILASIAAAVADVDDYGIDLYVVWPARAGTNARSRSKQAGFQFLAILATLGISIVGGSLTGLLVSFLDNPKKAQLFDDEDFWEVPAVYHEHKGSEAKENSNYQLKLVVGEPEAGNNSAVNQA